MTNSRFAVSSQTGLQKVRQLGVPVWNVTFLEGRDKQFHIHVSKPNDLSDRRGGSDFWSLTLLASAVMTIPRLDKEPLMAVISLKRSPWDWLFIIRSLPAKSTRHREAADEQDAQVKMWGQRSGRPSSDVGGIDTHTCIWRLCQSSRPRYPAGRLNVSGRSGRSEQFGPWSGSDWPG